VGGRTLISENDNTGTLVCTLLDRRSSIPLANARIMCIGRDQRVARLDTDEHGNFRTKMPQGVYDLVISANGYLSLLVRGIGILANYQQILTRGLIPGEGEHAESEPATAIGGFITDRNGRPVANVTLHANAENGRFAYTTRTDRSGAYILHGIIPEQYDLIVRAMDRTLARQQVPIAHVNDFIRLDIRLNHL